jgi:hypothetical protein
MSEAAFLLLDKAEAPMHYKALTKAALAKHLILTEGRTPEQSLRSQISLEIRRKKHKSRFLAKGEGVYTLSRFGRKLAKGEVSLVRTRKARSGRSRLLRRLEKD